MKKVVYGIVLRTCGRDTGVNITFTGHSLGGGLASIMSAWFNRPATTFDEAPFEASALNPVLMASVSAYLGLNGYADSELLNFIFTYPVTYGVRESQVTNHFVKGEFLEILRSAWPTVLGTDNPIAIGGGASLSGLTLHSINLAAALLIQDKLRADTVSLPNLLPAIFDETLYAKPLTGDERDFLTAILNDQIRLGHTATNGLLARFAVDIEKLAQEGAVKSDPLNKALIGAAIEDYYFMQNGFTKEFFQNITGGIGFDLKDIGEDWNSEDKQALNRLIAAVQQLIGSSSDGKYLSALAPNKWDVQAGTEAMSVTDTGTDNMAMIGGSGDDQLNGGAGSDFVFGGDGADELAGGSGVDFLIGGTGADTLAGGQGSDTLIGGAGNDTLIDADGQIGIDYLYTVMDGNAAAQTNYQLMADGDQSVDNSMLINTDLADHIVGGDGADRVQVEGYLFPTHGDGDDLIETHDGNDQASGGAGCLRHAANREWELAA